MKLSWRVILNLKWSREHFGGNSLGLFWRYRSFQLKPLRGSITVMVVLVHSYYDRWRQGARINSMGELCVLKLIQPMYMNKCMVELNIKSESLVTTDRHVSSRSVVNDGNGWFILLMASQAVACYLTSSAGITQRYHLYNNVNVKRI